MIGRPTLGFALSHPAHFFALGFGSGLAPVAPGTVGTLLGFPLYQGLEWWLGPFDTWAARLQFLAVLAVLFLVGVWACGRTGRDLGVSDHSAMNWDEIVAFMLILLLTPAGWGWQAFAFFAFRFFDVVKPPPIRHIDRTVKGGIGVMLDDILAAFYALLLMALVMQFLP